MTSGEMTQNKETVNRYMDGFRTSDHAQVLSCLTDDVEWLIPGASSDHQAGFLPALYAHSSRFSL